MCDRSEYLILYSATFPTYETLLPAVATDPVVLLILHIAVYIPHTCPLAKLPTDIPALTCYFHMQRAS